MIAFIRALVTWLVITAVLFVVVGSLGFVSVYEVALVLAVSVVLTFLVLRGWDRSRSRRSGSATRA